MVVTAFALSSSALSGLCMMVKWNMQGQFLESAFLQWFSKSHQVIQYAIQLTVLRLCNGRFVLPF